MKFTVHALLKAFKVLGIKYKSVGKSNSGRWVNDVQGKQRDEQILQSMKVQINEITVKNGEIIMVDECIFSSKTYQKKTWGFPKQHASIYQNNWRGSCIACVAAVSNKRGLLCYKLYRKSVNGD